MNEVSTRVCSFRLDPSGHIHATMHEGVHFDLEDAREAVAVTWELAGGERCGVLVDMRGIVSESREAREYFMSEEVGEKISAVALLVASPVSKVIANFLLRLGKHYSPTKMFTSSERARAWLAEQGRGQ